jgi:hypothetical protein
VLARIVLSSSRVAWAAAGIATAIALVSALGSARGTWHRLNGDYRVYAAYTDEQRRLAPIGPTGFAADLFTFYASTLEDGDRVYFQVPRRPYGTLDLHDTVAALGRFFFLPAIEVTDLDDATVVVSYDANPASLHRKFLLQRQNGDRFFFSRLAAP